MPEQTSWRFRRALARVEPTIERIVAEHATTYWQRGARRRVLEPTARGEHRMRWTIDDEVVLDLQVPPRGPSTLVVHDVSLHDPLQRALRTRHVHVRFATHRDELA